MSEVALERIPNIHVSMSLSGADRFHEHMELMLGRKLWPHLKICWKYITPLFELVSYVSSSKVLCFVLFGLSRKCNAL